MFFPSCHLRKMASGNGALARTGVRHVPCVFEREDKSVDSGLPWRLASRMKFFVEGDSRLLLPISSSATEFRVEFFLLPNP